MSSKDSKTKTTTKKTVAEKVVDVPTANTIVENKMEDKVVTVEKKGGKKTSLESTTVQNTESESVPVKASKNKVVKALEQENTVVETKEEVKADKKGKTKTVKEAVKETKKTDVKTELVDKKKTEKKNPVKVEDQVGGATVAANATNAANATDATADAEEEVVGNKLRYFKLIYNDVVQGRYCGKKPKQAANKAFSSIIKSLKQTGGQQGGVNVDINFTIRECTRNSKHKDYMYVGKRQVLDNPVKVQIANADGSVKQIEYKYHNKLQKAPKV